MKATSIIVTITPDSGFEIKTNISDEASYYLLLGVVSTLAVSLDPDQSTQLKVIADTAIDKANAKNERSKNES